MQMPQFTMDQRNILALEYHTHLGTRGFREQILVEFVASVSG